MNRKQRRSAAKQRGTRGDLHPQIAATFSSPRDLLAAALKHHHAGRLDEAERLYLQILSVAPRHAVVHNYLGATFRARGKLAEAALTYERLLALKPDDAEAHNNLGATLRGQGKLAEAVASYERALALKPNFAEANNNLGNALKDQGKLAEAVASYERALALKPNFAEAHNNLGNALSNLGKVAEAVASYKRALTLKSDYADAYKNLGIILSEIGQIDDARRHFETAIKFGRRNPTYYLHYADVNRFQAGDPHLTAMEELAKTLPSLASKDQIELHFALAKAYADLGKHEQSFCHLLEGNALKRQQISYDENAALGYLGRIENVFTQELIEKKRGLGDPSRVPVFVIGMPRSGTTLIEQILASHPKVFGPGELDEFTHALMNTFVLPRASKRFPETASPMDADKLRELGARYVDSIRCRAPWAERITDKMPTNFQFAGLIHLSLPNARIIHVLRNPLDTCLSCFSRLFVSGQEYTYELAELGRHYKAYRKLMDHWRSVLPAETMLEVKYEDLVADIERQSRRILDYCGLEWDAACLDFYKTERQVRTASAAQVRHPIYQTSIGRWRPYRELLRPLIDELGFDPNADAPRPSE